MPKTFFFRKFKLYYKKLHNDDVMTKSGMPCKFDWKPL